MLRVADVRKNRFSLNAHRADMLHGLAALSIMPSYPHPTRQQSLRFDVAISLKINKKVL